MGRTLVDPGLTWEPENRGTTTAGLLPIHLVIPGDPRAKGRPRITAHGAYTPKSTKEAQSAIQERLQVILQGRPPSREQAFGTRLGFYLSTWHRRDIDNLVKLVWDATTGLVWADDSQVLELEAQIHYADTDPRTEVYIWGVNAPLFATARCASCGRPIRIVGLVRKYCSRECASAGLRRRPDQVCARTGCDNKVLAGRVAYCSAECRHAESMLTFICDWRGCRKTVSRHCSQAKGRLKFCSPECKQAYKAFHAGSMGRSLIPDQRANTIRLMRRAGATGREIGGVVGLSESRVLQWLKEHP